jgi:arylformamidase
VTRLIDITPTVSERLAVWPGDIPYSRSVALDMQSGDHLTLSAITGTVHLGAHTDAPNHYAKDGAGMSERVLDHYYGLCQVIRVDIERGQRITPAHIGGPLTAPRVLFHTGTYPDPERWNDDFASLSPELVDFLADHGVVLVGIDTPSIDLSEDKVLLSHNAVARHDLAVLEGIVLEGVEPGNYTLVALPLKLEGADASPVRAVLVAE